MLQESLNHFQKQETTSSQAHLARILYIQSLLFVADGKKFMANAMRAAAVEAWLTVRKARELLVPEVNPILSADDFDGEIEYWLR